MGRRSYISDHIYISLSGKIIFAGSLYSIWDFIQDFMVFFRQMLLRTLLRQRWNIGSSEEGNLTRMWWMRWRHQRSTPTLLSVFYLTTLPIVSYLYSVSWEREVWKQSVQTQLLTWGERILLRWVSKPSLFFTGTTSAVTDHFCLPLYCKSGYVLDYLIQINSNIALYVRWRNTTQVKV